MLTVYRVAKGELRLTLSLQCLYSVNGILAGMKVRIIALALLASAAMAAAESAPVWQVQTSGTTASLRGIQAVNEEMAWASGTGGTVLRTLDGGAHWLPCAVPDAESDGKTLDFRGVQAVDAETAMVMASGTTAKRTRSIFGMMDQH